MFSATYSFIRFVFLPHLPRRPVTPVSARVQILWWHDGQELDVARFRSDVMSESRSAPYAHGETVGRRSELLWTPGASGCALRRSYSGRYVCRAEATLAGQLTHDLSATLHVDVQCEGTGVAHGHSTRFTRLSIFLSLCLFHSF